MSEPLRVAMVGPFGFHPNKTMRARALPLARALVARGHAVRLILPPWQTPAEGDQAWVEDGVAVRLVAVGRRPASATSVPAITARLVRETLAWRPDVVHAFKPKAYSGLVAWWLWQFQRGRMRLVTDTDDWEGPGGWNERAPYTAVQRRFFAWQERWGLRHHHALTVASRALESLARSHGAPPDRVFYLPNGPGIGGDTTGAAARRAELGLAGRPTLLLYSRLFEFDLARLVDVLARTAAVVPDLAILAVGAGLFADDARRLREEMARAGLWERVVDAGWLPEAALPATLAAADVGLYLMDDTLLNRTKCPVKLADMLACGLPVVAEAVGQVPEYVVAGETGLLRASGDHAGLAADLARLLSDPAARQRLGEGGRARVAAQFHWDRLAARALTAYGRP